MNTHTVVETVCTPGVPCHTHLIGCTSYPTCHHQGAQAQAATWPPWQCPPPITPTCPPVTQLTQHMTCVCNAPQAQAGTMPPVTPGCPPQGAAQAYPPTGPVCTLYYTCTCQPQGAPQGAAQYPTPTAMHQCKTDCCGATNEIGCTNPHTCPPTPTVQETRTHMHICTLNTCPPPAGAQAQAGVGPTACCNITPATVCTMPQTCPPHTQMLTPCPVCMPPVTPGCPPHTQMLTPCPVCMPTQGCPPQGAEQAQAGTTLPMCTATPTAQTYPQFCHTHGCPPPVTPTCPPQGAAQAAAPYPGPTPTATYYPTCMCSYPCA